VITVAYFELIPYEKLSRQEIQLADSATEVKWFSLRDFKNELRLSGQDIAFDHDPILRDLNLRILGKIFYTPIAFELVPESFTWPELRRVYEIVIGEEIDATNFKRKIRSMYQIGELSGRSAASGIGRPPARLRYQGLKAPYR